MRAATLAAASLALLLFGSARPASAQTCEQLTAKLRAGEFLGGALDSCGQEDAPRLAEAAASFMREETTLSSRSRSLLEGFRDEARVHDQRTLFVTFSRALQKQLADTPLHFEISPMAKFEALDPLLQRREVKKPDQAEVTPASEQVQGRFQEVDNRLRQLDGQIRQLANTASAKPFVNALLALALATLLSLGGIAFLAYFGYKLSKAGPRSVASAPRNELLRPEERMQRIDPKPATPAASAVGAAGASPPVPPPPATTSEVDGQLAAAIQLQIEAALADPTRRLAELERTVKSTRESVVLLRVEISGLAAKLAHGSAAREQPPVGPSPVTVAIDLERAILKEAWQKFQRENKEVLAGIEMVRDEGWREVREPLLVRLPKTVPDDLKPTFDAVMAAARDFDNLGTKLIVMGRLTRNEIPALPDTQELMRLREYASLLAMIQNSNLVADRLSFRLGPWIADRFLGFADLFLQKYQQAQMDRRQAEQDQLAPGLEIVMQVLKAGDLEPVEVTLGVTPFDSSRHVGRSTASDASLANGVIVGVVRNGFVRGGQRVIRQPEVIVNRVG